MRSRCLFSLCFLGVATPAWAINPTIQPPPMPVGPGQVEIQSVERGPAAGCPTNYNNTTNYAGEFYGQQNGAESMDDLHTISGGALCGFTIGYNEPGSNFFDLTVTAYSNNAVDSPPGGQVGGPWTITNLPPGANTVTLNLSTSPLIPESIWLGVQFSSATAGLLISDPPLVGTSHDYFYEDPAGYLSFGGTPKANFYIKLETELATPTETTSWGTIKSTYN